MADTLVDLLERCPIPAPAIHAEMKKDGKPISLSAVHSWRTGRDFPSPDNLARLAAALRRIGGGVASTADAVARLETPEKPSAGKRGPGKRGRPKKSDAAPPEPAATKSPPRSAAVRRTASLERRPFTKADQLGAKKRGKRKE